MAPLVSDSVEVVRATMTDSDAVDRSRWSLTLISSILGRTVLERSTMVMGSTNTNQEEALDKAISASPSGKRALALSTPTMIGVHTGTLRSTLLLTVGQMLSGGITQAG